MLDKLLEEKKNYYSEINLLSLFVLQHKARPLSLKKR